MNTSCISPPALPSQETISSQVVVKPLVSQRFWNDSIKAISLQLPSLTETLWLSSDLNQCCSSARNPSFPSWWKVNCHILKDNVPNSPETHLSLFPSSLQKTLNDAKQNVQACADQLRQPQRRNKIKSKTFMRAKVWKLFPDRAQKRILYKYFKATRDTYNLCLAKIREILMLNKEKNVVGFPHKDILRKLCINSDAPILQTDRYKYLLDIPYDIRDHALTDLLQAYQTNFDDVRERGKKRFTIKYRCKRNVQSFVIDSKAWKSAGIFYPRSWTKYPILGSRPLPDKVKHAVIIKRNNLGEYYISVPYEATSRIAEKLDINGNAPLFPRIVSIDPGVRTPLTCYDPSGKTYEMAPKDIGTLMKISFQMDRLRSKIDSINTTRKKRYSYRKAWNRMAQKIKNLVREFHIKTALFLCRNYEVILLPEFETQRMSRKLHRKIRNKTVRQILTWAHFTFRQRLLQKAELFGTKVILCDEHYTSKTCGHCGRIKHDLGGAKTFICKNSKCRYVADRDKNAAKNILLRYISKHTPIKSSVRTRKVSTARVRAPRGLAPLPVTISKEVVIAEDAKFGERLNVHKAGPKRRKPQANTQQKSKKQKVLKVQF